MSPLALLFVLLVVALVAWTAWQARSEIKPEVLHSSLKSGAAILVDVREPSEWSAGVAQQAALLPLSDLRGPRLQWNPFLGRNRGKQFLVYCQSGTRSALATALLRREGFNALNAGSLAALDRSGWPLSHNRS